MKCGRLRLPVLVLHALRSARRMWPRLLAICLIGGTGFAVFVGGYSAIDGLQGSLEDQYRKGDLADLEVRFAPTAASQVPDLGDLTEIAESETRLIAPGHLTLGNGLQLPAIVVAIDATRAPRVNRPMLLAGEALDPAQPDELLVERKLADYDGCRLGDQVVLDLGGRHQRLRVRGIAASAEFLITPVNPTLLLPSKGSLGVVFVASQLFSAGLDARPVNSLVLTLAPRLARGAAEGLQKRLLARAAGRLAVRGITVRDEQPGAQLLRAELAAVGIFLPAVVAVFLLVSFPAELLLLFHWIDGQRAEIGTALCLGFGPAQLTLAFAVPAFLIGIGTLAIGLPLSAAILRAFVAACSRPLGLPVPPVRLGIGTIVIGAAGIAVTLAAAFTLPLRRLIRVSPLAAVRESGGLPVAPRWRHPSPRWAARHLELRYAARNVFRNRGLAMATIVIVGSGMGLATSFLICQTSFQGAVGGRFRDDPWNALVEFNRPVTPAEMAACLHLPAVRSVIPEVRGIVRLIVGDRSAWVLLGGIQPQSGIRDPKLVAGRPFAPGDGPVVMIEQRLASKLQLAVGRTVVLERDAHRFQARVAAIRSGALVMGETFVPIAFGQQILGLGQQVTGALLMATGTTGEIKREIYSLPWVSRVFMRQEVFAELLGTGEHLRAVIGVAGNLSIPLALLFVFASFSQTIMQRRREFGMLAVLGYSDSVIVSIVALEVWLLGAATVALAVPFAWFAASFLTWRLSTAWVAVDTVARAADFVRILGPTLVLLPLAAVPSIRSVLREPLPRILGGQRFG